MKNAKKIIALVCSIALILLYVATLIFAIADKTHSMRLFSGLILCSIFIPLVMYALLALHKYAMRRSGRKDYYASDKDDNSTDTPKASSSDKA